MGATPNPCVGKRQKNENKNEDCAEMMPIGTSSFSEIEYIRMDDPITNLRVGGDILILPQSRIIKLSKIRNQGRVKSGQGLSKRTNLRVMVKLECPHCEEIIELGNRE
tara:strand:- start:528 stop:851 length:324 start_codon:yes stop_codon:yes gene_type:complete